MMQGELIETGSLVRSIEAVLFVASEALSIKVLAKLTGADESEVTLALARIDADYAERGIVLREVAGGYRFASAPAARSAVEAYLLPPKTNLSPAALETLAIVAYMQPVTKGDIEGIRGVSADSVLSTLVDRRFLAEAGRKDVAGRPILYKTTLDFLEAFGLRSLEELPPIDIDAAAPIELALPMLPLAAQPDDATTAEAEPDDATKADAESPQAVQAEAEANRLPQMESGATAGDADETRIVTAEERAEASSGDRESEKPFLP
jgi:segregation and condensation protein B